MKVVVALAKCNQGSDDMVSGRVSVVERLVAKPVGEGVDAEGGLLETEGAKNASIDAASPPIPPPKTADESREDQSHKDGGFKVVFVLPDDNCILVEISDVSSAELLWVLLHDHPTDVGIVKAFADGVWIMMSISIPVVCTVVPGPPPDGALDGTSANGGQINLQGDGCLVRGVGPKAVVSWEKKVRF